MSEQPPYGAPSPADGPTTPGWGAVTRAEIEAAREQDAAIAAARSGSAAAERPTTPSKPPTEQPTIPDGAAAARPHLRTSPGRTRIGGAWIGLILGAVVLVFLLIFILQNLDPARVVFLGLEATLPLGIWLLFAAIAGVLLLAIPGLGRMVQWRRAAKRTGRTR